MWVVVVLVLLAACYGAYQYFSSGEALNDSLNGLNPVDGCKANMLGCGCLAIIALLVIGYIINKFQ